MIIAGVTRPELEKALTEVNERYDGNVGFNNITRISERRHRVTLRVHSSRGPGHRVSQGALTPSRRLVAACWHVHGHYFEALPQTAAVHTARGTMYPGDWVELQVGSVMYPAFLSELCECPSSAPSPHYPPGRWPALIALGLTTCPVK